MGQAFHWVGFSGGTSGKESSCQCRRCMRCRFNHWGRKIPWSRKWQPALVFLPGKFHGQRNLVSYSPWVHGAAESWTQLSDWAHFYWTDQIHACVLSPFSLIWLFVTPVTVSRQAPLSMGFSRQEYWSGLPCLPPGDLPHPVIEPVSLYH